MKGRQEGCYVGYNPSGTVTIMKSFPPEEMRHRTHSGKTPTVSQLCLQNNVFEPGEYNAFFQHTYSLEYENSGKSPSLC